MWIGIIRATLAKRNSGLEEKTIYRIWIATEEDSRVLDFLSCPFAPSPATRERAGVRALRPSSYLRSLTLAPSQREREPGLEVQANRVRGNQTRSSVLREQLP